MKRYFAAVKWAATAADPTPSRPPDGGSKEPTPRSKEPPTAPGAKWLEDVLERQATFLEREAAFLERWTEKPHPIGKGRKRSCLSCGSGLAKGVKFCPRCGDEVVRS